jgi:hypothetical protein
MKPVFSRFLAAFLLTVSGAAAAADVGRVLLAVGDVVAVREGKPVRLALGSAVQDKDTLRTGPASNLQVRFTDESILSLRENSEIRIDEYRFPGKEDGTERAFFRLLKGGLRKITGLIGRTNHENYRMGSVVATIGIRGTDYVTRLCQQDCVTANPGHLAPDGQYGQVLGESHRTRSIDFSNERESRNFRISESFYTPDAKSPIQQLLVPPNFLASRLEGRKHGGTKGEAGGTGGEQAAAGGVTEDPRGTTPTSPPPETPQFVATEERGTSGAPAPIGGAPTIAGVGALFDSLGFPGETGSGGGFFAPAELTLSGSGASTVVLGFTVLPGFGAEPGGGTFAATGTSSGAVINETVSNPLNANWGRWNGGSITELDATPSPIPISGMNQFHYLFGPLTPPDVVAAKSGTFPLSIVGGTTPTNNLGELGSFSIGSPMVNFTARTVSATSFGFAFSSQIWSFPGASTPIQFAPGKGAFIDAVVSGGSCSSGPGGCGYPSPSSANLGMTGIFMGPTGNHLGVGFNAVTTDSSAHASTAKLLTCAPSC